MDSVTDLKRLDLILKSLQSVAVAFSGGVDSTLLAYRCTQVPGLAYRAVIVDSPFLPRSEFESALKIAGEIGIEAIVETVEEIPEDVLANTKDRCYLCKKTIIDAIRRVIPEDSVIVEGSNLDDLSDYRPGMRAVKELGVRSPLLEAGFTKDDIRRHARLAGLSNWDKPAYACLATRIPGGQEIKPEILSRVETAEDFLKESGIRACRVRTHGPTARIEVAPEERSAFFDTGFMDLAASTLKSLGFTYVTLDLEGYRRGNMNEPS